jgi:RNA polymerase sigma-70 factor (ECF subfamily)
MNGVRVTESRERPSDETPPAELLLRGYRYALALTHDPTRAEDLVSGALTVMIERRSPRRPSYLFTVIRNRFIDEYRRSKRVTFSPLDDADDSALAAPIGPDPVVDLEQLEAALALLRPAEREAVYLVYVEEYTAREVAQITHRPRGTILSLLHRAKAKLRARFESTESSR